MRVQSRDGTSNVTKRIRRTERGMGTSEIEEEESAMAVLFSVDISSNGDDGGMNETIFFSRIFIRWRGEEIAHLGEWRGIS